MENRTYPGGKGSLQGKEGALPGKNQGGKSAGGQGTQRNSHCPREGDSGWGIGAKKDNIKGTIKKRSRHLV